MKSIVLERLRSDKVVLIFNLTPGTQPHFAEMAGMLGVDCIWIDYEHHNYTDQEMFNLCLAARATGMDSMIRIRKGLQQVFFRPFELGAQGIVYPHCMSADEAREVVRHAKFHPIGRRGMDGVEPAARYGLSPMREYMEEANRETFVVLQLEDKEAIEDIDEIAAVEGADILFLGQADLSQSYGDPTGASEQIQDAIERVAAAAKKHGKYWGLPVPSAASAESYAAMGARFFACRPLLLMVREGIRELVDDFSALRA